MFRGRPWPGPGEPLWLDGDRDEAVALLTVEWDTCKGCGQSLQHSTDPDADRDFTAVQLTCAGCTVRETVAEQEHHRGRLLAVRRK